MHIGAASDDFIPIVHVNPKRVAPVALILPNLELYRSNPVKAQPTPSLSSLESVAPHFANKQFINVDRRLFRVLKSDVSDLEKVPFKVRNPWLA